MPYILYLSYLYVSQTPVLSGHFGMKKIAVAVLLFFRSNIGPHCRVVSSDLIKGHHTRELGIH
jgi:hypothetical protein